MIPAKVEAIPEKVGIGPDPIEMISIEAEMISKMAEMKVMYGIWWMPFILMLNQEGMIIKKAAYVTVGIDVDGKKMSLESGLVKMNPPNSITAVAESIPT